MKHDQEENKDPVTLSDVTGSILDEYEANNPEGEEPEVEGEEPEVEDEEPEVEGEEPEVEDEEPEVEGEEPEVEGEEPGDEEPEIEDEEPEPEPEVDDELLERGIRAGLSMKAIKSAENKEALTESVQLLEEKLGIEPQGEEEEDFSYDSEEIDKALEGVNSHIERLEAETYLEDEEDALGAKLLDPVKDAYAKMAAKLTHQNEVIQDLKDNQARATEEQEINSMFLSDKYKNIPENKRADVSDKVKILLNGSKGTGKTDVGITDVFDDAVKIVVPKEVLSGKKKRVDASRDRHSRNIVGRGSTSKVTKSKKTEPILTLDSAVQEILAKAED